MVYAKGTLDLGQDTDSLEVCQCRRQSEARENIGLLSSMEIEDCDKLFFFRCDKVFALFVERWRIGGGDWPGFYSTSETQQLHSSLILYASCMEGKGHARILRYSWPYYVL